MAKIELLNTKGEKVKDLNLNDKIWNIKVNETVLHDAIVFALSGLRQGTANTKTRGEVRGGGRKPWRQKGTGRARQGSIRSPQWKGGGVVFGPTPRSYKKKMNKKERKLAMLSALSSKYQNKELVCLDSLNLKSLKTKDFVKMLETLKVDKSALFVINEENENLIKASSNLRNINIVLIDKINVLEISTCEKLVMDEASIKTLEEVLK